MNAQHILVTGAAGSIGGALAKRLALRHPDAALTLVDRDTERQAEIVAAIGGRAHAAAWDLSNVDSLGAYWAAAVVARGPVDVLVNCAGIMEIRTFAGTSWSLGSRLLAIDLLSPLRLMNLFVEGRAGGAGAVVNVSSLAGVMPIRGCTYYGAAKAGLALASEIARLELRAKDVHVLTVYPGPVRSALESGARAQVTPGVIARNIPTGEADAIAARVVAALDRRAARVVYPGVYKAAYAFLGLSGWVTAGLSPEPLE